MRKKTEPQISVRPSELVHSVRSLPGRLACPPQWSPAVLRASSALGLARRVSSAQCGPASLLRTVDLPIYGSFLLSRGLALLDLDVAPRVSPSLAALSPRCLRSAGEWPAVSFSSRNGCGPPRFIINTLGMCICIL